MYVSNRSTLASDGVSLALSTEDKYDDDGSFVGRIFRSDFDQEI